MVLGCECLFDLIALLKFLKWMIHMFTFHVVVFFLKERELRMIDRNAYKTMYVVFEGEFQRWDVNI